MKYNLTFLYLFILLVCGCSSPSTDEKLLALDKEKLTENLAYDKITFYKFAKIAIRSSAVQDTTKPEYQKFGKHLKTVLNSLSNINIDSGKSISPMEALLLYKDYRTVKGFVKETDEDIFPTLVEGINRIYGDRNSSFPLLKDDEKTKAQNIEHAILSMVVLATRDLGQPFALYECSKTQPELLPDHETKTLLEFVRGFLFFSNNLFYLSEDGLTRNINWLDKNQNVPLPYTKAFFGWRNLTDSQTHTAFHGINYLFRGFDRLRMEREIDEKRGLDDFEKFLEDTKKLGLETELTLAIESYLYLKREDKEKAVTALSKLKQSPLLSNSEKEAIAKTIVYVNDREAGKALNGVYDKLFLSKIATKYMISVLAKIDWQSVLKANNVPHTDEIFATVHKVQQISNAVSSYTSETTVEKGKNELKKKGSELLDGAKSLLK
ncbi:short-chain dehydrogenase [Pedobacter ureilyticus]|uniref:Short-chain dehydrogenase n=1 Tax=Pedobacter ureilyticus TaxID=1393051 RepID=A0ABW9J4M1_9SPHI|nr:short-chain dehydrogenase [Pedobacter helvus]